MENAGKENNRGMSPIIPIFIILYAGIYLQHFLLTDNLDLMLFSEVVAHVVNPIVVAILLYAFLRPTFFEMASELKWTWTGVIVSVLLGIASASFSNFSITWLEYLLNLQTIRQTDISQIIIKRFDLAGVLYLAVTAGLFEEWLFKSALIRCFRKLPSQLVFVTTSMVLFVTVHYWQGPIAMCVYALFFAVPTAVYYYRSRNILNLIILHFVDDFVVFGGIWAWESKWQCIKYGC